MLGKSLSALTANAGCFLPDLGALSVQMTVASIKEVAVLTDAEEYHTISIPLLYIYITQ